MSPVTCWYLSYLCNVVDINIDQFTATLTAIPILPSPHLWVRVSAYYGCRPFSSNNKTPCRRRPILSQSQAHRMMASLFADITSFISDRSSSSQHEEGQEADRQVANPCKSQSTTHPYLHFFKSIQPGSLDLLCFPEMAFTGTFKKFSERQLEWNRERHACRLQI